MGGKYRLRSVLGEGGMGAVWLARNSVLEVDVAIKLIRHNIASPEASERLLQEARAAARLEHPSIIRVFDYGTTDDGDPYIAMELLRGESLATVLDRKGRLSASDAVRTLIPVVSAVCAAHAKGIVHRDLKPDNVILTENDSGSIVPKVLDFGIAKVRDENMAYRSLTQAGAVLGSPDYMCPEQARGRNDVDERCDVWAISVMLYEALAGRRPFNGDNYNALISSIIEDTPTPLTELAAGDEGLWEVVREGLSKDPAGRPTMRAFGDRLVQWAMDAGYQSDASGASLAMWFAGPARNSLFSEPPREGRPTGSHRREVATHSSAPPVEDARALRSSTTTPPVASTSPEWSRPPPRPRGAVFGAAVAVAIGAVLALTVWLSIRGSGTSERDGGRASASSVTAAPAPSASEPASEAASEAARDVSPVATAKPEPAETAPEPSSAASVVASASASATATATPAAPASHAHHAGRRPVEPVKPAPLAVPSRPNF